jgi:hypothetical protein
MLFDLRYEPLESVRAGFVGQYLGLQRFLKQTRIYTRGIRPPLGRFQSGAGSRHGYGCCD